MKNSAWYNRILQDKLQQLPVKEDANAAWQKMQGLLDANMPVIPPATGSHLLKTVQAKLIAAAGVVVTATILYFAATHFFAGKETKNKHQDKQFKSKTDSIKHVFDNKKQLLIDSIAGTDNQKNTDSLLSNDTSASQERRDTNTNELTNSTVNNTKFNRSANKNGKANLLNNAGSRSSFDVKNTRGKNNKPGKGNSGTSTGANKGADQRSALANDKALQQQIDQGILTNSKQGTIQQDSLALATDPLNGNKDNKPDSAQQKNSILPLVSAPDSTRSLLSNAVMADTVAGNTKNNSGKNNKDKPGKAGNNKSKRNKSEKFSRFELGLQIGANTNGSFTSSGQNKNFYGKASPDLFFGTDAAYHINKNWAVGLAVHALSPRQVKGSFTDTTFTYTTLNDTGGVITHKPGAFSVYSVMKFYTVDIPLRASYKASNMLYFRLGSVISIPVKQNPIVNTLTTRANVVDSVRAVLMPLANSTTIGNKLSFSISAGVTFNFNRFYVDAGYLRGLTPYTISSSLGSQKVNYSTFQFGIGYRLFKTKVKP